MFVFITLVTFSLLIFQTSIYYCFSLVVLVASCLTYLCINVFISSFVLVVMLIVYAGAVIIFIGYVSAVRPNYVSAVRPNYVILLRALLVVLLATLFCLFR